MGYSLGRDPRTMPLRYYLLALCVCGVHALAMEEGRLVEYRQEREGRAVYRVRFEEHEPVGERLSPRHVVLRDYARGRQLVVDVRSERAPDAAELERLEGR